MSVGVVRSGRLCTTSVAARAGALLCLVSVVLASGSLSAAAAEDSSVSPSVEYPTRAAAAAQARKLRGEGRRVEIVKVTKHVAVKRLEVGYYADYESARSVMIALQRHGIPRAVILRASAGYAVGIGEFEHAEPLRRQSAQLRALGYTNLHTVAHLEDRDAYRVVVTTLPGLPSGPVLERPTAADSGGVEYLRFKNREQAERKLAELRQRGYQGSIERERHSLRLKILMIRVYQVWSDAKRVAARLERHGIQARVVNDPVERGYAVSAGAYRDEQNLRARYRQIEKIGYKSIAVVPAKVTVTAYLLRATPPAAAQPPVAAQPPPPPPEATGEPSVLVFGGSSGALPGYQTALESSPDQALGFRAKVDQLWLEAGHLTRSSQGVNDSDYLHAAASARWRPNEHWEYRVAGRVDGCLQTGTPECSEAKLDYGDTYVRYRSDRLRVTAGAQTVIWGRVDEIPPTDRLSVRDASRFMLDGLQDRRRAAPALRVETFHQGYKLDLLWLPDFRAAELPNRNSIWYPVDRQHGRFIGVPSSPLLAPMIQGGTFGEDDGGQGGYGLRVSRTGRGLDYALTVQRARQSLPYYQMNETARTTLLATMNPATALAAASGDTFVARHPWTWVAGGDLAFEAKGVTWRAELAYLSDVPVTTTDLRMVTVKALDWVAGAEFYPGDANARVNLQLAGHHLLQTPDIIDRTHIYSFNGSVEDVFAYNRWRAKLRFSFGLDKRDVYLNPELAYIGWEPNEFYVGAHYFDGADGTPGGFHRHHSLIVAGWRARF